MLEARVDQTDVVFPLDDRVRHLETQFAVLQNDVGHVVDGLNNLVEQLKEHTEKIAEYIILDRKVISIESEMTSIKNDLSEIKKTALITQSRWDFFSSLFKNPQLLIFITFVILALSPNIDIPQAFAAVSNFLAK
jgi:hypothetical protein